MLKLLAGAAAVLLALLPTVTAADAAVADKVQDEQAWVFGMMHVKSAWDVTKGAHVTVAVIDSGVDPHVSDLEGTVTAGPDYTGVRTPMTNVKWGQHGTWMASIIAGHGHDDGTEGVLGVAPAARILSIRVIPDSNDPGYKKYDAEPEARIQQELADGIRYAVGHHAQVISMSIGYSAPSGVVRAAVEYAYDHGVVLVASSGNSGDNDAQHARGSHEGMAPVSFPAEYPGVIGVGAVAKDGEPAKFSSGNLSVRVAAPGDTVPAQGRDGSYWTVDGTSPACALVAGVAALLKSRYPKISPAQVAQALAGTAQHGKSAGYAFLTGFGIVDAAAALEQAGKLTSAKAQRSQVPSAAYLGGGPAALPAAPVAPRGDGDLVAFVVLGLVSLTGLTCGVTVLSKRRKELA